MQNNYLLIFYFLIFGVVLSTIIYSLSFFLIKRNEDTEKNLAYECGFNPYDDARKSFDIRFYLIAILFMVFDLESVFIFPWAVTLDYNFAFGFWTMVEFLIELVVGYVYVWYAGALEWE
jgi:NADH:ubiquinone oxidoreductase subunit 3 (subunit A)